MSVPVFYDETLGEKTVHLTLNDETCRHVAQVLRMTKGEIIHLTNGKGYLFTAEILSAEKKRTEVQIIKDEFFARSPKNITIAISPVKNAARFEWFLEKAAEIGVTSIQPLLCKRTERQHFREDRMNNILISAMLQSKQVWLTQLESITPFEIVISASGIKHKLIAHCENTTKQQLGDKHDLQDAIILIGPEGDFTTEEITKALQNNFEPVAMGNTRLRTETAGVVAATLLMQG